MSIILPSLRLAHDHVLALCAATIVATVGAASCSGTSDSKDIFGPAGPRDGGGGAAAAGSGGGAATAGIAGNAGTAGAAATGGGGGTGATAGLGGTGGSAAVGGAPSDASLEASGDAASDVSGEQPCLVFTCSADGRKVLDCWNNEIETCGQTQVCKDGACKSACVIAEGDKTSVGCHYMAIDMDEYHGGSCFVAMVANTWPYNAHITVRRRSGAQMVDLPVEQFTRIPVGSGKPTYNPYSAAAGIAPDQVALVFLSGATSSGVKCPAGISPAVPGSAVLHGTGVADAFEIETDVPIVAYQINPYGGGSAAVTGARRCSYPIPPGVTATSP
jgi:hypothetical protein